MLSQFFDKLQTSKRELKFEEKQQKLKPLTWVKEGLIVRIISDKYCDGKFYNKKVHVKTIMNDRQFLASDGPKILDDLREKDLETVLPASSEFEKATVMVLKTGEFAKILQKDKKKEEVTVQLTDTMEIMKMTMDDVCLY